MRVTRLTRVIVTVICVLAVCVAATFFWWTRQRKITDRDLLIEAWQTWNAAGALNNGTDGQIFEQLASQGYYEDARNLMRPSRDFPYFIVRLAEIRTKNGDIQGARGMLLELGTGELEKQAADAVALVQADAGDLSGALATIGPHGDLSKIIEQYGRHQINAGDFEGALKSQELVPGDWQLFYEAGDALAQRHEASRIPKLAATMHDPKMRSGFVEVATMMTRESSCAFDKNSACGCEVIQLQQDDCMNAGLFANQGKFSEAWNLINRKDCHIRSYVANKQYASDPATAERELLKATDRLDLATDLNELATQAAKMGNISDGFRLAGRAAQTSGYYDRDVVRDMAREWTKRSNPRIVRKWARSLSDLQLRSWALIGIAEALGHSVPPSPSGKPT